jgi:predicted RNA binding protein YcfA (HicA-like mRNA interferase family)
MALKDDKQEILGFGFEAAKGSHHFVVTIPRSDDGTVTVAEHFVYGEKVEDAAARALR